MENPPLNIYNMNSKKQPVDLEAMASQLACPAGNDGIKTGAQMQTVNSNMIRETIKSMHVSDGAIILEIGPGNAAHIDQIFRNAPLACYYGADTSATMIEAAQQINQGLAAQHAVSFHLTDGLTLPFDDIMFDNIFTVNTLYFWKAPLAYASEIHRVLKPDGSFHLAFAEKSFMKQLPFTAYGFRLYDTADAIQLLQQASFQVQNIQSLSEEVVSNSGDTVQRAFTIISTSPYK